MACASVVTAGWTHKKLIEENYELQMKLAGGMGGMNSCDKPAGKASASLKGRSAAQGRRMCLRTQTSA